jgi:GT2 family glycosyltransferase
MMDPILPTAFIVLPVHNRLNATEEFLRSIKNQTYRNCRVVICDDGSQDGTGDYLAKNYPEVALLKGNGSLWWTAGMNRCVEYVLQVANHEDYVLTINNDVILDEQYVEQKIERAKEYPGAIIGSLCLFKDNPNLIETSGLVLDRKRVTNRSLTRFGQPLSSEHVGVIPVTHLCGKGVLIPVEVFRTFGLYDAKNFPQYHADSDLTLRAHEAGYRVLIDFDSRVYSDVNRRNLGWLGSQLSLMEFVKTFRGPYSLNNPRIIWRFSKQHFPADAPLFFAKTLIFTVGGFMLRYLSQIWQKPRWLN